MKWTEVALCIRGAAPLIFNKMDEKAKRELLLPRGRMNEAARRANLKHEPLREYRDSVYTNPDPTGATRLLLPSTAFKAAVMTAALEIPGTTKASVGRLLQVTGYRVPIFGVPQLSMMTVRTAGMNKTPDVRTRAILPEWATQLVIRYPTNSFDPASVGNLFAAAGMFCGVGDFRQEKGKGSFGLFTLVNADDEEWRAIQAEGGRQAQDAALEEPEPFDEESGSLWRWYESEILARGRGQEKGPVKRAA